MPSKGILLFAHNSPEIDYGSMAVLNSFLIKHYMTNNNISLVTDEGTFNYLVDKYGKKTINSLFEKVTYTDKHKIKENKRLIRDTTSTEKVLPWYNFDRLYAYDFTHYDETLVLDVDYLIFNNALDYVFGNIEDFLMNSEVRPLMREHTWFTDEERVSLTSIKQYWATAFYFRKNDYTKSMFEFGKFVLENYDYYKMLYKTKGKTFRNDHLFSIVNHTFSGLLGAEIKSLPIPYILTAPDYDELIDIKEDEATFLTAKPRETYDFILTKTKNTNIHVMNKQSFLRQNDKILRIYQ